SKSEALAAELEGVGRELDVRADLGDQLRVSPFVGQSVLVAEQRRVGPDVGGVPEDRVRSAAHSGGAHRRIEVQGPAPALGRDHPRDWGPDLHCRKANRPPRSWVAHMTSREYRAKTSPFPAAPGHSVDSGPWYGVNPLPT